MAATFLSDVFGWQVSFELLTVRVRSTVEVRKSLTQHCEGLKTICEKPYVTASGHKFLLSIPSQCRKVSHELRCYWSRWIWIATFYIYNQFVRVQECRVKMNNCHIQQLAKSQRDEIMRAISGRGQYRLLAEFQLLIVPVHKWMKILPDQCQKIGINF